jgi:iron(III) transport system substrate-binding protein
MTEARHRGRIVQVILLFNAVLSFSACKQELPPSIDLVVDTDPYVAYRVVPEYTRLNKVAVKQFHFNYPDRPIPDTSGATSSAQLLKRSPADVYWSGDAIYNEYLRQQGLTVPYHVASDIAAAYRDPQDNWVGIAPRILVMLVRSTVKRTERPSSIRAYIDPAWKGKGALADPLKGSMRSHFAALSTAWGDQQTASFYKAARDNDTKIVATQEECADMVVEGDADFALVDSDVALNRVRKNLPVELIYPDQSAGELGAIVAPNGLSIIRGCKNLPAARRLMDYLTSRDGERRIILLSPAQVPLNEGVGTESPNMWRIESLHVMHTDYPAAAKKIMDMEKILGVPLVSKQ